VEQLHNKVFKTCSWKLIVHGFPCTLKLESNMEYKWIIWHNSQIHFPFDSSKPLTLEQNSPKIWQISGKKDSKLSLIIQKPNTCVKKERHFCEWDFSKQKPLSFFKNSPPVVRKAHPNTMTKTGKNKVFGKFMEKRPQRYL
jgi:hypothetical protein